MHACDEERLTDPAWTFRYDATDGEHEPWAETIFALANGSLGVRGVISEQSDTRGAAFLAGAYETVPIHYHERLKGFAASTDTRVPVASGLKLKIAIDGHPIGGDGTPLSNRRTLDLRSGVLTRRTVWACDGGAVEVIEERLVPLDRDVVISRYRIAPIDRTASVTLVSELSASHAPAAQGEDPRIGARGIEAAVSDESHDPASGVLVQQIRNSGIRIVSAMVHDRTASETDFDGLAQRFAGQASEQHPFLLTKAVTYQIGSPESATDVQAAAKTAATTPFEDHVARQRAMLDRFWAEADIAIHGDPAAELALRINMFHVFQSAPRDGVHGIAAKGLTGEGYEGHIFWDGEVFVLPMLACTAPEKARAALDYRYSTLDAARANARALDHTTGALFAWRTIAGRECSAHYPSGSAQYHINAAVAFAIQFYDAATGDTAFLRDKGGEMLAETARIWLQVGHFAADGSFRIHGVTGPDEYTALIDNNWYTNRMAQRHLTFAAEMVDRLAHEAPDAWRAVADRIDLAPAEIAEWRRAAAAMYLPFDTERGIDAQDDSFLGKPLWDIAGTPADRFPLLLHNHPMTLYRHQVAKQADLILALVLAGEGIDLDRKRRAFDYYAAVTVHDSTLSDCSFSILASEVGRHDAAAHHFRAATFVDVEDRHGNSHHGAHMAAMAGSWQALVWGFGGFRLHGATPCFAPVVPDAWSGYAFTLRWRDTRFSVAVDRDGTVYRHLDGPSVTIRHRDAEVMLAAAAERRIAP